MDLLMSVWKNRAMFTQKARCRLLWYLINKMCCHTFSTVNNEAICYDWNLKRWSLWYFQGIWCSHRPHLHSQHVHSLGCPSPLWVCHICQDITRTGGGKTLSEVRHSSLCFILCYFILFLLCAWIKKSAMNLFSHFIRSLYNFSSRENKEYGVQFNKMRDALYWSSPLQLVPWLCPAHFSFLYCAFLCLNTNNSKVILQRWIMGKMLICRGISILLAL